ncbi:MAG: sugar ABC transporter permease [Thaumarchaeota archaeon]|nr:sugar ABC transporter permease [Nitrososphaerota archaeon]
MAGSKSSLIPLAFVTPCLAVMLLIGAYPILSSIYLSVTNLSASNPEPEFVGLENYASALHDPNFWNSARVTIFYVGATVSAELLIGLILTLLLFGEVRGKKFFESYISLPLAIPPIVVGVLFSPNVILDDLNTLLYYGMCIAPFCSGNTGFFLDVNQPQVYYTMMIASDAFIWAPLFMLVMLAILGAVPKDLFEVADINGASAFYKFRYITLPSLVSSPALGVMIALRVIDNFRSFEIPYAWNFWLGHEQVGTPVDTFSVLMFKMLSHSSFEFPLAQTAAIALMLLAVSLVSTWVILRLFTKGSGVE